MDRLPVDVLRHIAHLAVTSIDNTDPDPDNNNTHDPPQAQDPWLEDSTIARAAAACSMAGSASRALGTELYRALLARRGLPDRSDPPVPTTQREGRTRKHLREMLENWGVRRLPPRNALRADLERLVRESARPPSAPVHPEQLAPDQVYGAAARYGLEDIGDGDAWTMQRESMRLHGGSLQGWIEAVHVPRRRMARERRARRDLLVRELEARGCRLRDDSRLCREYVQNGRGDAAAIADTMAEMRFFHAYTRYWTMFGSIKWETIQRGRDSGMDWVDVDHDAISRRAKKLALSAWVQQWDSVDAALTRSELPATLRESVQKMMMA
jgi:hypothetical protein